MPLSWNEIKSRTAPFVSDWSGKSESAREEADAQTFLTEFFHIFGIKRKQVAVFEKKVETLNGKGYIDLLWSGCIAVEMKSPGKNLTEAFEQALNYVSVLKPKEMPQGILVCDFCRFHYYDLEGHAEPQQFTLQELPEHIETFGFLAGYKRAVYKQLDPVNIEAAEKMGKLYDTLKNTGYTEHQLKVYLVRLMFCLFADDTDIFEKDLFLHYILNRTNEDGSDSAFHISAIFDTLNTPEKDRLKNIDEELNRFPFVNGGLFEERLRTASFDSSMRNALMDCASLDWSKISPAIFGSLFQSVMNTNIRHELGAHYTSEENILKLIHPLFLDHLREEFKKIKMLSSSLRKQRLETFHDKLSRLTFLDPACGCGNFLVIAYRELRLLEIDVIEAKLGGEKLLNAEHQIRCNVNQFYGIEIEEFPCKIAQTALWCVDHQMNLEVRRRFGQVYMRIPLTVSASINHANANEVNWEDIVPKNELSYILGNPPFRGADLMTKTQKSEVLKTFRGINSAGDLDYVCCWYMNAARYIQGTNIEVAFVSTNSITQGEQVAVLWKPLLEHYGININFAHQTFKWRNEGKGNAHVYCVIIGFSLTGRTKKNIFRYENVISKPVEEIVERINPYLTNAPDIYIEKRSTPLCHVPPMVYGSKPTDNGLLSNYTASQKNDIIKQYPETKNWFKPLMGSEEFLNGKKRWCLWLDGIEPGIMRKSKFLMKQLAAVRAYRLRSKKNQTQELCPYLFGEIRQPKSHYLLIPRVSSERRKYIPIGFMTKNTIAADSCQTVPKATLYEFGVLTSRIHMVWVRYVCGRLKSDYRYSAQIVYNNFPWCEPTSRQRSKIESAARKILDVRQKYPQSSLAALYDPRSMPPDLVKAHQQLDKAVEDAYRRTFANDDERIAFLFGLHQKLSGELFCEKRKRGTGRKKTEKK